MKPENLKRPYTWEERDILIEDRIWHIPDRCEHPDAFQFPGWGHPDVFGNNNPVNIEYCSGNGAWIAEKARAQPHINWVAIEKRFPRVRKIWSKIKNYGLPNLFVISGEGYNATKRYIPSESVANIFINFPDPWPKKRHAKYRIIQPSFTYETARILQAGGQITVVTDDEAYSKEIIGVLSKTEAISSMLPDPFYTNTWEDYGTSYFEDLWREKGKNIRYHQFAKQIK